MKKVIPNSIENKILDNRFVYYFAWLLLGSRMSNTGQAKVKKISKPPNSFLYFIILRQNL